MRYILFVLVWVNCFASKEVVTEIAAQADIQINGNRAWDIQVHDDRFYERVLAEGSLGLGESYMDGWWDAEDLSECMNHILRADLERNLTPSWTMIWETYKAKFFNLQTKSRSMKVIDQHYQLGNDLYERMLDNHMTYSCGYWKTAETLDEAQAAKYDLIAQKLQLKPGMRVLDIGCGWGGFAKYIAIHYKVEVVGITLSKNQAEYARAFTEDLNVEIRVQDYRDVDEKFDRIVEIGMFEHVGTKNYRTFFESTHKNLNDDGMLMLHTIGSDKSTEATDPWISKYIFPNSHLPSVAQIGTSSEGLYVMEDWHNFSADYDTTLMAWHANFNQTWPDIQEQYPDPFYRMWNYYLLSCAGGFRARTIQLWQVVFAKKGLVGGYQSVR